jgi:hypothetical protein
VTKSIIMPAHFMPTESAIDARSVVLVDGI